MKNIQTTLVWFSDRDGNGIVKDVNGNEYYIDSSVLTFDKKLLQKNNGLGPSQYGLFLLVDLNESIKDCRCGKNVRIIENNTKVLI